MNALFLKLLNLSLTASCLVLVVLILRLIFRKAPRWIFCVLWGLTAVRLICPVSIESSFSVVPEPLGNGSVISEWADDYVGKTRIIHDSSPYYDAAVAAGRKPIPSVDGGCYVVTAYDQLSEPATIENTVIPVLSWIWLTGCVTMLIYALISYLLLKHRISTATLFQKDIKQSERVDSPFVLGFFRPTIYLPYKIENASLEYVIAHEQAHIRRKDHWWKPIGFMLLSVYWFNPLLWITYILFCRDIEAACDEKVIKDWEEEDRKAYSTALLNCSVRHRPIAACPLAFGETGVKKRINSVMNYKKPAFWIVALAMAATLIAAVCLLTDPAGDRGFRIKHTVSGKMIETNIDDVTGLVSFVLQTADEKEIGFLITDETLCLSFVDGLSSADFRAGPATDVLVSVNYYRPRRSLVTKEGKEITAYNADQIQVTGYLKADTVTLADGARVNLWQYTNAVSYKLQNGIELLKVQAQAKPDTVYIDIDKEFDELGETAQNNILEYYRNQGLLYDEQSELEKAYSDYLRSKNPSEFDPYMLFGQRTIPTASNQKVMYFLTSALLPIDGFSGYERQMGAAFDKATGEHIDNWNLFSCPPEEAIRVMLDTAGVNDPILRTEMEKAFHSEILIFFPNRIEIFFQRGTLPSQENTYILGLDYDTGLSKILCEWAIPAVSN